MGRIEEKTETIGGVTATWGYDYDPSGRLVGVIRDGSPHSTYTYDANDNRLTYDGPFGAATATYDAQDRLLAYGDTSYTYTAAGELVSKSQGSATVSFDYDALGSLRGVTLSSGLALDYVVDGQTRRVGKKVGGTLVEGFLYRDQLNPVAELDGSGAVVARFVYGSKPHVPDYLVQGGATYRIVSDHLGSVRLVVDVATGAIAQRLDYDAFGRITLDTNPGFQPFGFAGGLYDPQTGLVRFGARDYDPEVGRWTAKDPIGFDGGDANLYSYVLADPVNFMDPRGLQVELCQRPNEIEQYQGSPIVEDLPHFWLKTPEKEAGLGEADGTIPGQAMPDQLFPQTAILDHSEEPREGVRCSEVPLVDEGCVNEQLEIGKLQGTWFPILNDCMAFVNRVISTCRNNPGRPKYRQSPL